MDEKYWSGKEKTKFRQSKLWKTFRKKLIETRGKQCELCGSKYSGKRVKNLQIHHLDDYHYEDLTEEKYRILCVTCHRLVELIASKLKSKTTELKNKEQWLLLLKNFLPKSANQEEQ